MVNTELVQQVAERLGHLRHYDPDTLDVDLERMRLEILAHGQGLEVDADKFSDEEIRDMLLRQHRRRLHREARYLLTGVYDDDKATTDVSV